jgi:hypothetical protein
MVIDGCDEYAASIFRVATVGFAIDIVQRQGEYITTEMRHVGKKKVL